MVTICFKTIAQQSMRPLKINYPRIKCEAFSDSIKNQLSTELKSDKKKDGGTKKMVKEKDW
jgi:hypothetical protein